MMKRDHKTIALVAAQLLAAHMISAMRDEEESLPGRFIRSGENYDDFHEGAQLEKLLHSTADLADRLVICCDPETIDAHNGDDE